MLIDKFKRTLTTQILFAMVLALIVGTVINHFFGESADVQRLLVNGGFHIVGSLFMAALKMMIVPLVFFGLCNGIAGMGDINKMGRLGIKTLTLYLTTTAVAVTLGITVAAVSEVGQGHELVSAPSQVFNSPKPVVLADALISIIPTNPIAAMAAGEILPIIVFSLLFGVALAAAGPAGRPMHSVVESGNEVMLKMISIIMKLAPIGLFSLLAKIFSENGVTIIVPLASYFAIAIFVLLIHAIVTNSLLLTIIGGVSPALFFKKIKAALVFGFSTSSSSATIPITLRCLEKNLGVDRAIASFTAPLGATLNMDGTAIVQGVATVFVANAYGVDLALGDFIAVIGTATVASIGTAAVRGSGVVMLAMVFQQVGLPLEGIMLIMAVDPLLDMVRTAVNVAGDAMVATLVAKSENGLNLEIFNNARMDDSDEDVIDLHALGESTNNSTSAERALADSN
jgi:Na+/H+-dicarboxylate symporter